MSQNTTGGAMILENFKMTAAMKHESNVRVHLTDDIKLNIAKIHILWGTSETLLLILLQETSFKATGNKVYYADQWDRKRLMKSVTKWLKADGRLAEAESMITIAKSHSVISHVRNCMAHYRLIGVLNEPKDAFLYDGINSHAKGETLVLPYDMVEKTIQALDFFCQILTMFRNSQTKTI